MIDFTIEVDIDRPVHHVFVYSTDPERLPTWQTNTVSSIPEGDGAIGLGTRSGEIHRAPGGKELESLVEVTEYAARDAQARPRGRTSLSPPARSGGRSPRARGC